MADEEGKSLTGDEDKKKYISKWDLNFFNFLIFLP